MLQLHLISSYFTKSESPDERNDHGKNIKRVFSILFHSHAVLKIEFDNLS